MNRTSNRTTTVCRFLVLVLAIPFAGAALTGCDSAGDADQNAMLLDENIDLRDQLDMNANALDQAHNQLRDREESIANLQMQLTQAESAPPPTANPFGDIPGVSGTHSAGEVTATLESDVLFSAGKAVLRDDAKRSLERVARVIRQEYPGTVVRVAGHTDSDPIRKSGYKSNHHLGFERAWAVREFLVQNGLGARNVYVASHGPDRSKSTKKASRRVDIAVVLNDGHTGS